MEQVVAGILQSQHRVLLCHRRADRAWYPNVWDLPGGHVRSGETPARAPVRELAEELGVEVGLPDAEAAVVLVEDHVEFHIWRIAEWTGEVRNTAEEEHDSIGWFSVSEVLDLDLASASYVDLLFP
jgi:8-oxo-dGTP diphosphatase